MKKLLLLTFMSLLACEIVAETVTTVTVSTQAKPSSIPAPKGARRNTIGGAPPNQGEVFT